MKFINGWNYMYKDVDRFHFGLRIGILTVYELSCDVSSGTWRFMLLNLGVGNK